MLTQDAFNLTDADFRLISDVVREHCGISLSEVKKDLVRGRLARQIRTGGFASARDYIDYVFADRNGAGFAGFIDAISTNLTSFFREEGHFQYLAQSLVPAWLAHHGSGSRCLLAWSAGCSTGEEAYSIAMTLMEAFRTAPGSQTPEIRILASDISTRVLETARIGVYPDSRLAGVLPQHLSRYFHRLPSAAGGETCYEISPQLRAMIRCRHLNLIDPWPFRGPFDLAFCRNVMIYFDEPARQELIGRFWDILRPGGLLFTGHSESLAGTKHHFRHIAPAIYQKRVL
jgi:chemotaxis protein methyltransferase CheR